MRIAAAISVLVVVGCVAEDTEDPAEDLGIVGGKADKVTTRNITLRKHRSDGSPSTRTFTVTANEEIRISLGYADDAAQTRIVVDGEAGELTWQPTIVVPASAVARKIRLENTADHDVAATFHVETRTKRTLRVATWNIRWYGIGGDVDMPKAEHRNATLKSYFDANLGDADVVIFEEILDVAMLRAKVVPADWTCSTYTNTTPEHQFVVACLAPGLVLTREADDDDIAFQPVALGTLRPAVTGVVRDARTRAPIARLAGVHLKALPNSTARRLEQARILGERFATHADGLPAIVLGDFNAHRAVDTGGTRDDWDLIEEQLGIPLVETTFANTYRDKAAKAYKLDHLFTDGDARDVNVVGPCNLAWETDRAAIEAYFDSTSDHCALIANVTLQ